MKRLLKWLGYGLGVLVLVGAVLFVNFWYFKPWSVNWFYNRVFLQFALDNPELLSSMRLLEKFGIQAHNRKFSDSSPQHEAEQAEKLKSDYAMLHEYDRNSLEGQPQLSYDILDYFMGSQVEGDQFRYYDFPVNQLFGIQSSLPDFLAQQHQVTNEEEAKNYNIRLTLFGTKFDQVIEGLKLRETKGIIPPKFTVDEVLAQMKGFVDHKPQEHMLYTTFKEKLDKIDKDKMDQATRDRLLADAADSIEKTVYPAYQRLIAYFEQLQPKATSNDGVWRLPNGDAFYAHQVRDQTTTNMTPDQVHELGLKEVERISGEMEQILRDQGLTEGTIGKRVDEISKRPDQLYPDTDEGRAQALKDYQSIIDEVFAGLDPYFSTKPKARVEVKRVPVFAEKTAPQAYYQPGSFDGARNGMFFANLRDMSEIPKLSMRTLSYHEAVPGHHFQISIAQELKGLPIFRQVVPFTAYVEGWALYSERLAWEAGFEKNPLDNLGRLRDEMFRACRLVVDTGLHAKHWTREQAITYMIDHTGMGEKEITSEVERYLVIPGQALAYKVGMLKILELRDKARTELGDKYDIRDFHEAVLKNGALPLTLLERVVDEYIAKKKAA